MTLSRSDLIATLATVFPHLPQNQVDQAARTLIDQMTEALCAGQRIEIRGFGAFFLRHHPPAVKRNPKTGAAVHVEAKAVVHFRPGKELRNRVTEHTNYAARGDGHPTPRS